MKKKRIKPVVSCAFILVIILVNTIHCVSIYIKSNDADYFIDYTDMKPVTVGFTCMQHEPANEEIYTMIDKVIFQLFGEKGLRAIIKPGDKVVIKVNLAGTNLGPKNDKNRGCITDPRIVRYTAERVRSIIGWEEPAGIIITDAEFHRNPDPSTVREEFMTSWISFYWARLERTGDDNVDPEDFCYDYNRDGILDGTSGAVLVNCDSIPVKDRFVTEVEEPTLGSTRVYLPKFLRTKEQANGKDEYCDVFIGIPVLKSHGYMGLTGAMKLHYGLRYCWASGPESGRSSHSGFNGRNNIQFLADYISALHRARTYDFIIMDAITGNRQGPHCVEYWNYPDNPTDYIFMNSIIAGTDPVAVDTVSSLFAGYKPESIVQLQNAAFNRLGVCWPQLIRIAGWDAFTRHRHFLLTGYTPEKVKTGRAKGYWTGLNKDVWIKTNMGNGFGTYPFADHIGTARTMPETEFYGCKSAEIILQELSEKGMYIFEYRVTHNKEAGTMIARIDFLVNGNPVEYAINPAGAGAMEIDLSSYKERDIQCRIAVWDNRLNCTMSDILEVAVK